MEHLLRLLPDEHAGQIGAGDLKDLEEIRISAGNPVLLRTQRREIWLEPKVSAQMVQNMVQRICRQSVYAYQNTLCQGFVTLNGGHRVGICGSAVFQNGALINLVNPSSLNIRTAREVPGCADGLMEELTDSALLVGPPCCGKTTLLRDAVRQLSDHRGQRVSLVDERGEIGAVLQGVPRMKIGRRTDVLTYLPKGQGIMMVLRTMNPQWIAVDEITAPEDVRAMEQAAYCGVRLLATAHAFHLADLEQRPLYASLLRKKIFQKLVLIRPDRSYTLQEVPK